MQVFDKFVGASKSNFINENQFFNSLMSRDQIEKIADSGKNIPLIIKGLARQFLRKLGQKQKKKVNNFFANYFKLISNLSQSSKKRSIFEIKPFICNDLGLHLILLSSYSLLQNNRINQARQFLKRGWNYNDQDIIEVDTILLCLVLSNLSMLYVSNNKPYKGLTASLRVVQLMEKWIKQKKSLLGKDKRNLIMEDSVILINSYLLCKIHLVKIVQQKRSSYYKEMLQFIEYTGYRYCIKFLGINSYFTKRFNPSPKGNVYLPIYRKSQESEHQPFYEEQIGQRLNLIIQMLSNRKEKVVVIEKQAQIIDKVQVPQVPIPEIVPEIVSEQKIEEQKLDEKIIFKIESLFHYLVQGWNIAVLLLNVPQKNSQGDLELTCKKNDKIIKLMISEIVLNRMLILMNLQDIKPYQCDIKSLNPRQFINYCIVPFLSVQSEGNIEIYPKSIPLIDPFLVRFVGQDCLIFINHIYFNILRLSISPRLTASSLYLNIELTATTFNQLISLEQSYHHYIQQIWESLYDKNKRKKYASIQRIEEKRVKVIQQTKLKNLINSILMKFQEFMNSQQSETSINELLEGDLNYYKYQQIDRQSKKSRFFYVRFLQNICSFDIYIENCFETYSIEGLRKAKGNILYSSYQFQRDFGIIVDQLTKSEILSFCQMLCQKYGLLIIQKPLSSRDQQIYVENAIFQFPITSKSYRRKLLPHQKYLYPITTSILSINNQIPIGIKIIGYNPIRCIEEGYFVHLIGQVWRKPDQVTNQFGSRALNSIEQKGQSRAKIQPIFRPCVQNYEVREAYFLADWMERTGFQQILKRIQIKGDEFIIIGLQAKFNRMDQILDLIVESQKQI